jgi:hypothetical protein
MKSSDIVATISTVGGTCSLLGTLIMTTYVSTEAQLHPGATVAIPPMLIISTSVLGAVGLGLSQFIRIVTNKTDAPSKSVVENAPSVPKDTAVYTPGETEHVGTVVTTTSTEPIIAPTILPQVAPPGQNGN